MEDKKKKVERDNKDQAADKLCEKELDKVSGGIPTPVPPPDMLTTKLDPNGDGLEKPSGAPL